GSGERVINASPGRWLGIALVEVALVPVRIGRRALAGRIQLGDLFRCERPAERAEVLAQLFLVACADHDVGNRRTREQPVQRDLRDGLAGLLGDLIQRIDDREQVFVLDDRAAGRAALRDAPGFVLAATDLAGEATPAEWAPDHRAEALV